MTDTLLTDLRCLHECSDPVWVVTVAKRAADEIERLSVSISEGNAEKAQKDLCIDDLRGQLRTNEAYAGQTLALLRETRPYVEAGAVPEEDLLDRIDAALSEKGTLNQTETSHAVVPLQYARDAWEVFQSGFFGAADFDKAHGGAWMIGDAAYEDLRRAMNNALANPVLSQGLLKPTTDGNDGLHCPRWDTRCATQGDCREKGTCLASVPPPPQPDLGPVGKHNLSPESLIEWASSWVPENNRARFAEALASELRGQAAR